jgi:uncharacterized protein
MMSLSRKHWSRLVAVPFAIATVAIASPTLAQEKVTLRTLTVTGRGFEEIPTTLTQVRLGVEAQGKTANEVQQEVARRSNSVVALLKSRGVLKLETTGINLSPVYSYANNTQKLTGYSASNIVSFRVPTEKAGTLLDDAVKAGASRIDGVSFVAEDAAISQAQKQALRKATQDAQEQANAVFSALNLTRKEVMSIQVNGASTPPPIMMDATVFRAAAVKEAPSPVMGGDQRVEGTVTLQISY